MDARRALVRAGAVLAIMFASVTAVGAVAGASPIAGAGGGARWHLVDYRQVGCFDANVHDSYYGVYIRGHWLSPIDVGAAHLPPGGSYSTSYAPIPPGQSNGEFSLAYVHVALANTPPIGRYIASMWATDGSIARQVSIALDVKERCGY
jgi:hypothetical protein